MKSTFLMLIAVLVMGSPLLHAESVDLTKAELQPVQVFVSRETVLGRKAVRVTKDPHVTAVDEPTFAKLMGPAFKDGVIEVDVLAQLLEGAPEFARGFIGVAFRITNDHSRFESFYVRPTNGRADDQVRRNRATQYFSYPDYKFDRLRKEAPGRYESYSDMGLNEWITIRIVVRGSHAKMYVNGQAQPVLVVNDLKHGADSSGAIGLWVDVGTAGYFSNLRISPQ